MLLTITFLKGCLFIRILIIVIELWICFSFFIAFWGVKVSNAVQSRYVASDKVVDLRNVTIIDLNSSLCSPYTVCLKSREFACSLISSFQWPSSIAISLWRWEDPHKMGQVQL